MYKVAIIDDEKSMLDVYRDFFDRFSENTDEKFSLKYFSDGLDFIDNYKSGFDIIFTDIDMPKMNGLETAKRLRQIDDNVILIFVTRFAQYAIDGYQYGAFDFVLKPLEYGAFYLKLRRALKTFKRKDGININFRYDNATKVLSSNDIVYVEVLKHSIIYHTETERYETYGTLAEVRKILEPHNFIMCHRCYLVNLAYVTGYSPTELTVNGISLPLSRPRKKEVLAILANYFGGNA